MEQMIDICVDTLERTNEMMPATQSRILLRGAMEKKGTGYLLRYTEDMSGQDQEEKTEVMLHISDERVMMMRQGQYAVTLVFERGKHYESMYQTPFGQFPVGLQTIRVDNELTDQMGSVHIEYQMMAGSGEPSYRIINIAYKAGSFSEDELPV